MPTEIGPIASRTAPIQGRPCVTTSGAEHRRPAAHTNAPVAQTDAFRLAATSPIDGERVAMIRDAIAEGRYPILPMHIADALIAASIMLSTGQ